MTIKQIFHAFTDRLKEIYTEGEAGAITRIIFEELANIPSAQIFLRGEEALSPKITESLETALKKLLAHVPVQYVTGNAWFLDLKFRVNEHVLIPRPETEELVHEMISELKATPYKKILDIGTGSGCIPVSIKKNIPQADVISVDISEDALRVAKENAGFNNVAVKFYCLDFTDQQQRSSLPIVDMIISNPPYIPEGEKKLLDKNVTAFEPHIALFVPENDALLFYKCIRDFAEEKLNSGGKIFLEVHENFAAETAELFSEKYAVKIKKDIPGKERMLIATRNR